MNTMEIANKVAELCRAGKNDEVIKTLLAPDAVSVEAFGPGGGPAESKGTEAILGKSQWWRDNHETHSVTVTGPWPHGNRFVLGFQFDVTQKASGKRFKLDEVGLYTVENGKIVREEFFYAGM
jgi:ketosteroid isomerase-like protein